MARLPYVHREQLPASERDVLELSHIRENQDLNVMSVLAHNTSVLRARREFGQEMREHSGLSDREHELIILTVAYTLECAYEWEHHIGYPSDDLVTDAEIRAIVQDDLTEFSEKERTLIKYVSAFATRSVDDEIHAALEGHYNYESIVGIGIIAMAYIGLAHGLDAYDVDIEGGEFEGWDVLERD